MILRILILIKNLTKFHGSVIQATAICFPLNSQYISQGAVYHHLSMLNTFTTEIRINVYMQYRYNNDLIFQVNPAEPVTDL